MKIGIVGSGMVGATAAYAMVMRGVGREIVMVDADPKRARAQADDILHAVPFANPLNVTAGDYADLQGSRAVILAAGVSRQPGESRLALLRRNATIFRQIVPNILAHAPDAVLIVASNPVDVTTHLTAQMAVAQGWPSTRVIGSGTTLDTARFRTLLSARLGVDSHHIHAYVIGEHGDSEVLTWSAVTVAGVSLDEFCRLRNVTMDAAAMAEIDDRVRHGGQTIIAGKGATFYGIGSALARITEVVLQDQRAVLTVCTPLADVAGVHNVTVSLPHLVGGEGVLATFPPALNEQEQAALQASARVVKEAIESLDNA
jgi:L-lactate dehydrogenase